MKIDELISELEQVKEEHGNLEVAARSEGMSSVKNVKRLHVYGRAVDIVGELD